MTRILAAAFLILAAAPLLRAGEPTPEQFKALCGVAQDMDHTTVGMAYEDQFTAALQEAMRDALKSCAGHAKAPFEVDLVFVIGADGKVEKIFADPKQPISACVAGKLDRQKLPRPPRADWMQLVNIYIKE